MTGALGEEPGEMAVGAGDGYGEGGDGLAQCGESLDRWQRLVTFGGADGVVQDGGGFPGQG
ncbi:hypothetical protein ACIRYZ_23160 [Kitasatospora sp. NPDC101155]|uniref:hypothetical protein n=1 Tax=Kitasatospora sp. NPDC101155 TaxID=3364097 RepID=UPI00382C1314